MSRKNRQPIRTGFGIFCPTIFQGTMPACYEDDYPVVFATEREAQREIADHQTIRIQQFLDNERAFDDAITTDEFVLPVKAWPDRTISIKGGRAYGKQQ